MGALASRAQYDKSRSYNDIAAAEGARRASLSIAFVSNEEITRLNQRHLRRRTPTDVVAFGFERAGGGDRQGGGRFGDGRRSFGARLGDDVRLIL